MAFHPHKRKRALEDEDEDNQDEDPYPDPNSAYPCDLCTAKFRYPCGLRYHMKTKHPWVEMSLNDDEDEDEEVQLLEGGDPLQPSGQEDDPLTPFQDNDQDQTLNSIPPSGFVCKLCRCLPNSDPDIVYETVKGLTDHLKFFHEIWNYHHIPSEAEIYLNWTAKNSPISETICCWLCWGSYTSSSFLKHLRVIHNRRGDGDKDKPRSIRPIVPHHVIPSPSHATATATPATPLPSQPIEEEVRGDDCSSPPQLWCILCARPHYGEAYKLKIHLRDVHGFQTRPLMPPTYILSTWTSTDLPNLKCWICLRSFISSVGLVTHIKKKHQNAKSEEVPFIPSSTYLVQLYSAPCASRAEEFTRRFQCMFCRSAFSHTQNLRGHLKTVHNLSRERQIPSGNALRSWTPKSWISLKCWVCSDTTLTTPQDLLNHILTIHGDSEGEDDTNYRVFVDYPHQEDNDISTSTTTTPKRSKRKEGFKCVFCRGPMFLNISNLKLHLENCHGLKGRLIPSKKTLRSWTLYADVVIYRTCWICSKICKSSRVLMAHIMESHWRDEENRYINGSTQPIISATATATEVSPKITSVCSLVTPSTSLINGSNTSSNANDRVTYSSFFCMTCSLLFDEKETFDNHPCHSNSKYTSTSTSEAVVKEEEMMEALDIKMENGIFPD